jgi:acetyl esterase/lipase
MAACALCLPVGAATAPEKLPLWAAGAPNAMANGGAETVRITEQGDHVVSNVHQPSLTIYLPKSNPGGTAVILVPGGGHRELWTDHEGHSIAHFLNEQGIAAFVLYYRLARAPNSTYTIDGDALNDLKRAIRTVRARAGDWGLDARKIGVMGFSAGGQLGELAATRFDAGDPQATDAVERVSSRPDFAALVYPGTWPDLKIDGGTPPMFLLSGSDDRQEVLGGLTQIYLSLRAAKVPAELHFYDGVGHGFGLRSSLAGPVAGWPRQFVDWLRVGKFLADKGVQ